MAKLTEEQLRVHNAQMLEWSIDTYRRKFWNAVRGDHPVKLNIEMDIGNNKARGYNVGEITNYDIIKLSRRPSTEDREE